MPLEEARGDNLETLVGAAQGDRGSLNHSRTASLGSRLGHRCLVRLLLAQRPLPSLFAKASPGQGQLQMLLCLLAVLVVELFFRLWSLFVLCEQVPSRATTDHHKDDRRLPFSPMASKPCATNDV